VRRGRESGGEGGSGVLLNTHVEIVSVAAPPTLSTSIGGAAAAAARSGEYPSTPPSLPPPPPPPSREGRAAQLPMAVCSAARRVGDATARIRRHHAFAAYACVALRRLYVLPHTSWRPVTADN